MSVPIHRHSCRLCLQPFRCICPELPGRTMTICVACLAWVRRSSPTCEARHRSSGVRCEMPLAHGGPHGAHRLERGERVPIHWLGEGREVSAPPGFHPQPTADERLMGRR